jgi:hypothetical protein
MPTRTERYRFLPFTIEDVNAIPRRLPGGYADVTRGGGTTFERVVFLGPGGSPCRTSPQEGARKEAGTVSPCLPRRSANQDMTESSSSVSPWAEKSR